MKPTKYRVYLSDGNKIDIESQNAGEAIEGALRKYRGIKVITCISGQSSTNGKIEYEIPNHEGISEDAVFAKARGKKPTIRKECSLTQKPKALDDSLTNMSKHRTQIEIDALDRHLIYGVEKGWKNSAIASEAGVSASYCTVRLKSLGYQSMLLSPMESELIREARRQKAIAA